MKKCIKSFLFSAVNLPQSMAPNAATAGGNPIQSMSTMGNPIGANMGSHVMLSSQSSMVRERENASANSCY